MSTSYVEKTQRQNAEGVAVDQKKRRTKRSLRS